MGARHHPIAEVKDMNKKTQKKNTKIDVLYTIIAIRPYDGLKGHIEIWLEPVDPLLGEKEGEGKQHHNILFNGAPDPEQFIQQMVTEIKTELEGDKEEQQRDICLVIPRELFHSKQWHYGATINGQFELVE